MVKWKTVESKNKWECIVTFVFEINQFCRDNIDVIESEIIGEII